MILEYTVAAIHFDAKIPALWEVIGKVRKEDKKILILWNKDPDQSFKQRGVYKVHRLSFSHFTLPPSLRSNWEAVIPLISIKEKQHPALWFQLG